MSEINIRWNEVSHVKWTELLKQADRCSFQQAWEYGAVFEHSNIQVDRFVAFDQDVPVAIGQVITRRILGFLKFRLLLKGPIWLTNVSDDQKQQILTKLRLRFPLKYFSLFAFSPDEAAPEVSEQNIYDSMKFRQIISGNSTILIDLRLSEDQLWQNLYGKNRTHIRKAKKSGFNVIYGNQNHCHTDWLLEQEKKQQEQKKYQGLPVGLVKPYGQLSLRNKGVYTAFAVEKSEDTPLAEILFLCHGRCATYHIGWNGNRGRKCRALNLLLWEMMLRLKSEGIECLDLGGINTEKAADITRYKLGFGGDVINLQGTYM